ncbi:MAG: class I SAM-dependent methyltransferase [Candidatus Eisenbacteria bacterium]
MARSLVPEPVDQYLSRTMIKETPVQKKLRAETSTMAEAGMQIGADQGALFAILVRAIGAKQAIEIGTFTGYSALAVAAALPEGGRLVACDVSEEWTSIGKKHWEAAGVAHKIDLRIAPATETIAQLLADGGAGTFDFAFIDADKPGYDAYYEGCLQLIRQNGLIAIDNVLWSGKVADESVTDESTAALRKLNAKVADDARVEACLLTVGDGVMLVRVK